MPTNPVGVLQARGTRSVVLRHPESWAAFVIRKKPDADIKEAENPENDEFWDDLGYAVMLVVGADRGDAPDGSSHEITMLIEPTADPGDPEHFTLQPHDIVYKLVSDDIKFAYEVVRIENNILGPAQAKRYVTKMRWDMHYIANPEEVIEMLRARIAARGTEK